jgi:hypothetical protein
MHRKTIFILLIILGSALLLAAGTYWLDSLTSEKPLGLGDQILKWSTTLIDILTWISAYLVNKKSPSKSLNINVSGGNPLIPVGENSRAILMNGGYYVEKLEIKITPQSEEEIEKNKRKYKLRNIHEFEAPKYLYKPIQESVHEFNEKLDSIHGGYMGVFGPPGSGKSTFLTQTLRTLPVRSVRYYAYVPDAQDPSVLRGEAINFFHDTTLQIQILRNSADKRPDPSDRVALYECFIQQLNFLGQDFQNTGTKTIILVDGLDHIAREQHPDRSLIEDLPEPASIPDGVYIVLGSQTIELPDLSPNIKKILSLSERVILMGKLSPQNVYEIIHQTLPDISNDYDQKIYQLVDGHPLSLNYLLNALHQSESSHEYSEVIDNAILYKGNIEDQYFAHWNKIENDLELAIFLGFIARIRGPIPINWVAHWSIVNTPLLIKLKKIFGQYFSSDSLERWEFFHNSFRIFLEAKTADGLPGRTSQEIDQDFHRKLAQLYENSDDPYRWETLYHYYKAGEHKKVVDIAQYSWFNSQVKALRPIDAIETDVRLSIKSAGNLLDTVALIRLTLIGASLQQRAHLLSETRLPHLLIDAGLSDIAIEYARDGARLRIDDKDALSVARELFDINKREAIRIFELAEPLEYLSGRLISKQDNRYQRIYDLLIEWVECSNLFHSSAESIRIIRRIQIEPHWNEQSQDVPTASRNLQNWLLFYGALDCCERSDWDGWNLYFEAFNEKRDHARRYLTLLHTVVRLRQEDRKDLSKEYLKKLVQLDEPTSLGSGRNQISNYLSMAESIFFLETDNYKNLAKNWIERISAVPLSDNEISSLDNSPDLINLHFRYGRMKFALANNITVEQLLKDAELNTTFGAHEENEEIIAKKQVSRIAYCLAQLWVDGNLGSINNPDIFLSKIKWILDFLESGWKPSPSTFQVFSADTKTEILIYIVMCAFKHGEKTLEAIKNEYSLRWNKNPKAWPPVIQRKAILAVVEQDAEHGWEKNQLELIEGFMLQGSDVYERIEQFTKQAEAWLQIGERSHAIALINQLVKCARGVYTDKDYQLGRWANWIRKTNTVDGKASSSRTKKYLRQVLSIIDTASGVDDALINILKIVFDISPHKSIQLYKKLLERKVITYDEGLINILLSAIELKDSPLMEIYEVIDCLLFPFSRNSSPQVLEAIILKMSSQVGKTEIMEFSEIIIEKIKTSVVEKYRSGWYKDLFEGLIKIGIDPNSIGLHEYLLEDTASSSSVDYKLHLISGEKLTLRDAISHVSTINEFRSLLDKENKTSSNFFQWYKLANQLIEKVTEIEQIYEICGLMETRLTGSTGDYVISVYTQASKRLYELGFFDQSNLLIQKAVNLSKPSGWSAYYDGGIKYKALHQAIKILGEEGRKRIIEIYTQDLSERHRYPEEFVSNLDEISEVLFDDIPYLSLWPDIENHIDELFDGVIVDEQPEYESIFSASNKITNDDASRAIAELLTLMLDFPAYPVSNGAIEACAKLLLKDNSIISDALQQALKKHDSLARQSLITLEIVSQQEPSRVSFFQDEISELCKSTNMILRMIATKIQINTLRHPLFPAQLPRELPTIYSLQLPEIAAHRTELTTIKDTQPILLGDPALELRPLDIEARELAKRAEVPENNLLFHASKKLKEIEIQRTWISNGLALDPKDLTVFLEKINLIVSHTKPKISPCKHALGYISAELYDAGKLSFSDLGFLEVMFRDYDPSLFLADVKPRPDNIDGLGGVKNNRNSYIDLPSDWVQTPDTSLPLLKSHFSNDWIILAEWTHIKRLQRDWPEEERISLLRATAPHAIWGDRDVIHDKLPFANNFGYNILDYPQMVDVPEADLVIAHNGFMYQMERANWIGLNPQVGLQLGWQPAEKNYFAWKDNNNQLMVESILWQDGNFDSANWYDQSEVGYGWLVIISKKGYERIFKRYGTISRGGVIRRSLGQFSSLGRKTISSILDNPN